MISYFMKKEDFNKISLFAIIAGLFFAVFFLLKPSITGYTVYTPSYYNWTFESSEGYIYDSDLILIENNSARLKLQAEEYTWTELNYSEFYIVSAYEDGEDKTHRVESLDSEKNTVKDDEMFNVVFENGIENGDIIALYLHKEEECNVYLCNSSVFCSGDYGSISFPNVKGWYNITVTNLEYARDGLAIGTDDKIKINYIKVIREREVEYSDVNYSYPESAILESENFNLPSVNQLNLFYVNEELNGQEIKYYYSSNGESWDLIPENGSLPELNQIKIKAEFNSDTVNTPVLYNLVLTYEYCSEDWNCSEWSGCYENGTRTRICGDLNECGSIENKSVEIENCTYFPCYYEVNESEIISLKVNETTIVNMSDIILDLVSEEDLVGVSVNIDKNLSNLSSISGKGLVKGVNISVGSSIKEGVIKIYYDDIGNLDEDSLKIYYYNNGSWEELNSSVNKDEKYVYSLVEHFSIYGVFGDEIVAGSSGSSGGGSSSFRRPVSEEAEEPVKEESKIEREDKVEEGSIEEVKEEIIEESKFKDITGLVVYNAKKAKVSVPIGLGILILMIVFFARVGKFKRKMKR